MMRRMRFTLRRLLIVIAALALLLAVVVEVRNWRRRQPPAFLEFSNWQRRRELSTQLDAQIARNQLAQREAEVMVEDARRRNDSPGDIQELEDRRVLLQQEEREIERRRVHLQQEEREMRERLARLRQ